MLVVLGHCIYVFGSNIFALKLLDKWIYIFHMPLFFLVSGYLFKPEGAILKKVKRLIIPFIVWSLPVIVIHLISFHWNSNFVLNDWKEILNILVGGYYWYLIYLFYFILVTKLVFKIGLNKKIVVALLLIYLAASIAHVSDLVVRFVYNYFFFLVGYVLKLRGVFVEKTHKKADLYGILFLALLLSVLYLYGVDFIKVFAAIAIIGFIILLMEKIAFNSSNFLCRIGKYTLIIYLFDQYLIDIETKVLPTNVWLLVICSITNILLPIFVYKFIITRNKVLLALVGE
ncbi:acyltransferase family protein [Lactobacillus delbrueckii subsp. bulgaricus]